MTHLSNICFESSTISKFSGFPSCQNSASRVKLREYRSKVLAGSEGALCLIWAALEVLKMSDFVLALALLELIRFPTISNILFTKTLQFLCFGSISSFLGKFVPAAKPRDPDNLSYRQEAFIKNYRRLPWKYYAQVFRSKSHQMHLSRKM